MTSGKVQPIGNVLGVVLPAESLSRLNAKDGNLLYLSEATDGSLLMTTHDASFAAQMQAAEEGMAKYRYSLRELAK